jgi:hypothetical protein
VKKVLLGSLIAAGKATPKICPEQYQLHSALFLLQEKIDDSSSVENDGGYRYKPYAIGAFSDDLQKDLDLLAILGGVKVRDGSWIYDPDVEFIEEVYAESVNEESERAREQKEISETLLPLLKLPRDSLFDQTYRALNERLRKRLTNIS